MGTRLGPDNSFKPPRIVAYAMCFTLRLQTSTVRHERLNSGIRPQ